MTQPKKLKVPKPPPTRAQLERDLGTLTLQLNQLDVERDELVNAVCEVLTQVNRTHRFDVHAARDGAHQLTEIAHWLSQLANRHDTIEDFMTSVTARLSKCPPES